MSFADIPRLYIGLGVLLLCFLSFIFSRAFNSPLSHVPGPWYSKYTDWVLTYHWLRGRRAPYVHRLHQIYGPVVRIAPDHADITAVSARKQIYNVKEAYVKSPWYTKSVSPGNKNMFSTSDVEYHRRHRRLLAAGLTETSLKTLEPSILSKVRLCVQRMGEEMEKRGVVDVYKWFIFMTTDIIGELSYGESFHMLETGKKNEYLQSIEQVARSMSLRPHFPFLFKLSAYFYIPVVSNFAKVAPNMRKHAVESLQRYRDQVEADPINVKPSLFTKMFIANDEEKLTFDEIRDDAGLYIIGGSDTTSVTLTCLVWAVTRQPSVRDALVKELQNLPHDFTHKDVYDLPYLNMVIDETLRLYPVAPGPLPRVVPKEGADLAGYWFPGGATVSCQTYSMQRDPAIYPDPERFDPSRWAKPTKEMKDAFSAFGGGSRACLGMHLARMELRLATAKFFKTFPNAVQTTLEGMSDDDMELESYLISNPRGMRCLVEAR